MRSSQLSAWYCWLLVIFKTVQDPMCFSYLYVLFVNLSHLKRTTPNCPHWIQELYTTCSVTWSYPVVLYSNLLVHSIINLLNIKLLHIITDLSQYSIPVLQNDVVETTVLLSIYILYATDLKFALHFVYPCQGSILWALMIKQLSFLATHCVKLVIITSYSAADGYCNLPSPIYTWVTCSSTLNI